ncbi:MAG: dienelactone hydrolase family protein [Myxococcales bacterium]|nr:dienelactone hydrolase family protein [Myxococcales bacterium]
MMNTARDVDVRGEEVSYSAGKTTLKGYLAWDASKPGPLPGVIVVHEWWGHNDYVRRRARMLAEEGYVALALDMYGDGRNTQHPEDAQKFVMEAVGNAAVAKERFLAAYDLLKQHHATEPSKIAAIGYCFGGAVVLQMARLGAELDGVASFHGTLSPQGPPAQPGVFKAKALVLHGADDPLVPPEQVAAFKKEMEAAGVDYSFIAYPGAQHAFTNPSATERGKTFNMPLAYDEAADNQSWAELQKFLSALFADS